MRKVGSKLIRNIALTMTALMLLTGCSSENHSTAEIDKEEVSTVETEEISTTEIEEVSTPSDLGKQEYDIENVTEVSEGKFTCSFADLEHDFIIDFPEKVEGSPLVIMLHGYGQNAESFRLSCGFEKDACQAGYTVVYVTGAKSSGDATGATGWNSGVGDSDNPDVAFLKAFADYIHEKYKTDKDRVYAVGFSNGAFMTHRLALEAGDTFSAVVSVSGMMPESIWETRPDGLSVGVFQVTGEKDDVVPKNSDGSADTSINPAIEDVIEYYKLANDMTDAGSEDIGKASTLSKYENTDTGKSLWNLFIKDGRHSWPDEGVTGINMNQLILDYFSQL